MTLKVKRGTLCAECGQPIRLGHSVCRVNDRLVHVRCEGAALAKAATR